MGSLDKYCRLCATNTRTDQLLKLYTDTDQGETKAETSNATKIRTFLNFSMTSEDRLPKKVCVQCVTNLDYCIQFVDRCRRVESLLQRGLDVDYVAQEADYRYTYLFPAPYSSDNSSNLQEHDENSAPFFGNTPSTSQEGCSSNDSSLSLQDYLVNSGNDINNRIAAGSSSYSSKSHPGSDQKSVQKENRVQPDNVKSAPSIKKSLSPQKVAMFKNDVSVDNMVVEIEPDDLIPRKSGNVRAEYPWRVGGTNGKRNVVQRPEKRPEIVVDAKPNVPQDKADSPNKKMRTILPKGAQQEQPMAGSKGSNQVMIPVTLRTPCKQCNTIITASSLQEFKAHNCSGSSSQSELVCNIANCGRKFNNKNSYQYHIKHCHNTSVPTPPQPMPPTQQQQQQYNNMQDPNIIPVNPQLSGPPNKPFACPYEGCNKSYHAKTYLIQHERLHTGERPFKCSNCGKGFSRVLDLKKHTLLKVCY